MSDLSLSNSEMRAWQQCHRRWYLSYYKGWRLKASEDPPTGVVNIGSQVHLALEAKYGYGLDPLAVLRWSYEDVMLTHPDVEDQLLKDRDMALAMVEGYVQWASETGVDADVEVVGTEHEVSYSTELPSGITVTFRGKLDLVVRRLSDGRLRFRDWKTVGSFEKANALLLDQQMRFYVMLQAFLNLDPARRVDGALFMMLKRSKRTSRATGPFYEQAEVSYNRHDLNATWLRASAVASEIHHARAQLDHGARHHYVAYPSPGDYCSWGCPFYTMCHLMDDGSRWEAAIESRFEVGNPYRYYSTERISDVLTAFGATPTLPTAVELYPSA